MKCPACRQENKDTAKFCKKCDYDFSAPPAWFPDAAWHLRTLGVIYACLVVFYFGVNAALSRLPKPYQLRHIPIELTPWLRPDGKTYIPEDELKAPAYRPDALPSR